MATVHAEQNAITDCAKRGVSCAGASAYITHYPCINCMKMLCAAGIKDVKYTNDYNNDPLVPYFSEVSSVPVNKMATVQNFISRQNICGFILDDEIKSPSSLFMSSSESLEPTSPRSGDFDSIPIRCSENNMWGGYYKSPGIKGSEPLFPRSK